MSIPRSRSFAAGADDAAQPLSCDELSPGVGDNSSNFVWWAGGGPAAAPRPCWSSNCAYTFGYLLLLVLCLHASFDQSPAMQNTLWQMMSIGMLGPGQPGIAALAGVPASCGNAAPLQTLSWMNPADFNHSTVGFPEVERRLYAPAFDAPIFVVGCGHSGTTELITLLDRHPLVTAYLDGPGMEFAIQPNSFVSPWPRWAPVTSRHDDRTFADLARRKHAAHWAVKSPSNICRLGYILKALPHARVVMMVRDGRDTMLSLAERFPNEEATGPLVLGRWINDNTAGLLFSADPRVMVVRLEDLTQQPHEVLPTILSHVGVPSTWRGLSEVPTNTRHIVNGGGRNGEGGSDGVEGVGRGEPSAKIRAIWRKWAETENMGEGDNDKARPSRDLLSQLISPNQEDRESGNAAAASSSVGGHGGNSSKNGPKIGNLRPDGRKNHDQLRKFQVNQPLRPVFPKWPTKMTENQKSIFKGHSQAVRLLVQLGYANGTDW